MKSSQTLERAEQCPLEKGSKWGEWASWVFQLTSWREFQANGERQNQPASSGLTELRRQSLQFRKAKFARIFSEKKYQRGKSKKARERERESWLQKDPLKSLNELWSAGKYEETSRG